MSLDPPRSGRVDPTQGAGMVPGEIPGQPLIIGSETPAAPLLTPNMTEQATAAVAPPEEGIESMRARLVQFFLDNPNELQAVFASACISKEGAQVLEILMTLHDGPGAWQE